MEISFLRDTHVEFVNFLTINLDVEQVFAQATNSLQQKLCSLLIF